jgi:hypothetical protein
MLAGHIEEVIAHNTAVLNGGTTSYKCRPYTNKSHGVELVA